MFSNISNKHFTSILVNNQNPVSTWSPIKLILPDDWRLTLALLEGEDLDVDLYESEGVVYLSANMDELEWE